MNIELTRIDPSEDKLNINYCLQETPFGNIIIASTENGICLLNFILENESDKTSVEIKIKKLFGRCIINNITDEYQQRALRMICREDKGTEPLKINLKGTEFQFAVWRAISEIPAGQVVTYKEIALKAGYPKALRATGSAVGANPVAILIPCHRVVRSDGDLGNYRYGRELKKIILNSYFESVP